MIKFLNNYGKSNISIHLTAQSDCCDEEQIPGKCQHKSPTFILFICCCFLTLIHFGTISCSIYFYVLWWIFLLMHDALDESQGDQERFSTPHPSQKQIVFHSALTLDAAVQFNSAAPPSGSFKLGALSITARLPARQRHQVK